MHHRFRYAIVPGVTVADAVRARVPVQPPPADGPVRAERWTIGPLDNEAVVVEAVKAADDRSGDVVLRCYESLGGRATVTLRSGFPVRSASVTDLLERPLTEVAVDDGNRLTMQLKPFEVVTLRLSR